MIQHIHQVLDNFLALPFRGIDQNGGIGQCENPVVVGGVDQCNLADQACYQTVFLIQNGHQKASARGIATNQNISKAIVDDADCPPHIHMAVGIIGIELIVRHMADGIVAIRKTQLFQHGSDLVSVSHQNGTAEALFLRFTHGFQNVLTIRAGNHHTGRTLQGKGSLNDKVKLFSVDMNRSILFSFTVTDYGSFFRMVSFFQYNK